MPVTIVDMPWTAGEWAAWPDHAPPRRAESLAAVLAALRGRDAVAGQRLPVGAPDVGAQDVGAQDVGARYVGARTFDWLIDEANRLERELAAARRALAELHAEQIEEAALAERTQAAHRAEREAREAAMARGRASGRLVAFPGGRARRTAPDRHAGQDMA